MKDVSRFFNKEGELCIWPSKRKNQVEIIKILANKFEENRVYSEKEVNSILNNASTINDCALLRRELVDCKLLSRTNKDLTYTKVKLEESDCECL